MARIKEDRPITQRDDKGNFNVLIGEIVALFITIQGNAKTAERLRFHTWSGKTDPSKVDGPKRIEVTVCENVLSWDPKVDGYIGCK